MARRHQEATRWRSGLIPVVSVIPATVTDPVRGGQYTPFGNSGYNILRGDGIRQNDLSLTKFFNVGGEGRQLQFRAEFLNALNNPQFLLPLVEYSGGQRWSCHGR